MILRKHISNISILGYKQLPRHLVYSMDILVHFYLSNFDLKYIEEGTHTYDRDKYIMKGIYFV